MNVADILASLDRVKSAGKPNAWSARCPAHTDRHPSLSIGIGEDDRVLLHCHADCSLDAICSAIGITPADLFEHTTANGNTNGVLSRYPYSNLDGEVTFAIERRLGKTFAAVRPDGNGGWVKGANGQNTVYRLPEVAGAIAEGADLYVCEGEKDADALSRSGVVATCNPFGAGKWDNRHTQALRGAHSVIVVADRDDVGRAHAFNVAECLRPVVADVRIVQAATGKDAYDHLEAGLGLDDFEPVDAPAAPTPTRRTRWNAVDLMNERFPEPRYAVPGLVTQGETLLVGAPKIGKSWLAVNIALAVASGGKALDKIQTVEGDVLYLALEDPARRLQGRLKKMLSGAEVPHRLDFELRGGENFDESLDLIRVWRDEHAEASLLVIDVWAKLLGARNHRDNIYEADYLAASRIKQLADEYELPSILVHHDRKMGSEDFVDLVSGSKGLTGAADSILLLKRSRGSADAKLCVTGRDIEEETRPLRFDKARGTWVLLDDLPAVEYLVTDVQRQILEHLRIHPDQTPTEIATATGLNLSTVKVTCTRLADDVQHYLVNDGKGHYRCNPVTDETRVIAVTHVTEDDDEDQGYGLHGYDAPVTATE